MALVVNCKNLIKFLDENFDIEQLGGPNNPNSFISRYNNLQVDSKTKLDMTCIVVNSSIRIVSNIIDNKDTIDTLEKVFILTTDIGNEYDVINYIKNIIRNVKLIQIYE